MSSTRPRAARELLFNGTRGFAMGAADLVPGVSGGTVALVLGIYERLIASIRAGSRGLGNLLRLDLDGFRTWFARVEWLLVLPLLAGILLAVLSLARLIQTLLHEQPELMAAIFLGLVAGSVVIAWRLIRAPLLRHALIIGAVGVLVFVFLGVTGGTSEQSVGQVADPALLAYFIAGAVAICAMILPGISGSFLLVIMGMYGPLLAAVTRVDILVLAVFMAGCVIGLALFSQVLHRALQLYHDVVLAALIGLMAGSVRVLWPWPAGVESTELGAPDGAVLVAVIAAAIAFVAVVVLAGAAQRLEAAEEAALADQAAPADQAALAEGVAPTDEAAPA
jgi:putative membrane protein